MKRRSKECVYVRGLLDAFADDELTKRDRTRVIGHLSQCSMCTEELFNIRNLIRMLAAIPAVMPQHDLVEHAVAAAWIAQRAAQRNVLSKQNATARTRLWMRPWTCAVYMSAAAVFALGFWTSWSAPEQLMDLFETTKIKDVLVPSDCYVAHLVQQSNQVPKIDTLLHLKLGHKVTH